MRNFRSLKTQLTATYFMIILLTVSVFEFVLILGIGSYYHNLITNNIQSQADRISSFFNNYPSYSGVLEADAIQIIDKFSSKTYQLDVLDNSGKLLASSKKSLENGMVQYDDVKNASKGIPGKFLGKDKSTGEEIIAVSVPIREMDNLRGIIRISTSLSNTNNILRDIYGKIILFGIFLIFLVTIISLFTARAIAQPINEVVKVTKEIAKGNKSIRNKFKGNNEIAELSSAINNLASQLEEEERMKNSFISTITHELRTPLTSIKGWAQTLKDSKEDPRRLSYGLDIIITETERLSDMVEEMLDFSRIQSSSLSLYCEIVDINRIIREVFEQMIPEAQKKSLRYTLDLPSEQIQIYADPKRIRQVLINLLDNALKFTPEYEQIEIQGKILDNLNRNNGDPNEKGLSYYEISIRDTGIGVLPEDQRHLKERFYKGRKNKNDKGIGLGLAICDELVKLHNGQMEIRNNQEKGSEVIVILPLDMS